MKRLLLGAVGVAAMSIAAPALAADLPVYSKAPAMIPVAYDWSGFYVGANGGWGTERRCFDSITAAGTFIAADGCHTTSGGVAGGQIGYRWQSASWVFGVEGQGDWANLRGSNQSIQFPAQTNRSRIDAFGLFTGQVGYAWNTVLLYVKGGGAVTADRFDINTTFGNALIASSGDQTRWGGTVGAGAEFSFAPNWSAGVEYDHLFMGNKTNTYTTPFGGFVFQTDRVRQDVDLVTVRVNYRWGGPVIAKY